MQNPPAPPLRFPLFLLPALLAAGCIGTRVVYPVMPTDEELVEFEAAGPVQAELDADQLRALNVGSAPYRVVTEDLLQIELPIEVTGKTMEEGGETRETLRSRVDREGVIRLPLIGAVEVGGKSLGEIEELIGAAYYPTHLTVPPNVVVTVESYHMVSVGVMGAVENPGLHELRTDRRSLLGAIMAAGGIQADRGASAVRILRPGEQGAEPILLPVRNANIPFSDVPLTGGETVVVEPLEEHQFTVIGLVTRSGAFPYPDAAKYNLMQALAIAGGVSQTAAPRFATVYRQKQNGEIIAATFKIDGTSLLDASNIRIKPGDVVSVDHTAGSWTRQLLSQVLGFRASVSATSADQF
ncbi:MAG: polysaccharide biosynthesis/export family protein [Planctomycetota bacterium]